MRLVDSINFRQCFGFVLFIPISLVLLSGSEVSHGFDRKKIPGEELENPATPLPLPPPLPPNPPVALPPLPAPDPCRDTCFRSLLSTMQALDVLEQVGLSQASTPQEIQAVMDMVGNLKLAAWDAKNICMAACEIPTPIVIDILDWIL